MSEFLSVLANKLTILSKPFKLIILSLIRTDSLAKFPMHQIACSWISLIGESIKVTILGIPPLLTIEAEYSLFPPAMLVKDQIAS